MADFQSLSCIVGVVDASRLRLVYDPEGTRRASAHPRVHLSDTWEIMQMRSLQGYPQTHDLSARAY